MPAQEAVVNETENSDSKFRGGGVGCARRDGAKGARGREATAEASQRDAIAVFTH